MHLQLLVDNTRRGIVAESVDFSERLAAEIIHSLLFHESVAYLDAFIINHPALRKSFHNYPWVAESLKLPICALYQDDRFQSPLEMMEANARHDAFHPAFGTAKSYQSDSEAISAWIKGVKVLPYNHLRARENFTNRTLELFSTGFAAAQLENHHLELTDLLNAYLAEKRDNGVPTVLRQSDFEGGARTESRLSEFAARTNSAFPIRKFESVVSEIARYSYRSSLVDHAEKTPAIMHDEQTAMYRALNHERLTTLSKQPIRIESPYFHAKNLLKLNLEDIEKIRAGNSFKQYQETLGSFSTCDLDRSQENLSRSIEDYIKSLNAYIGARLHAWDRYSLAGSHKIIDFSVLTSSAAVTLGASLNAKLEKVTSRVEVSLKIGDVLRTVGVPVPALNSAASEAMMLTLKVAPSIPFEVGMRLHDAGTALIDRVERAFGDSVASELFPDEGTTGYGK